MCGGIKPVNGIPTPPLDNWISNGNTYINKRLSEEFEDTKGVISICKWKDRQDNGQESGQARQRSRVRTGKTKVKSQDRQDKGQESGQTRQTSRVRTGKTKVKSQDRQEKGPGKKYKRTNNNLQNIHIKLKID
jgi:hypothetical protein